jgi:hypothetical protein
MHCGHTVSAAPSCRCQPVLFDNEVNLNGGLGRIAMSATGGQNQQNPRMDRREKNGATPQLYSTVGTLLRFYRANFVA